MGRSKIIIPKDILKDLYWDKNLSLSKIADKYDCAGGTIAHRIQEYRIPYKTCAQARMRYKKYDFNGSDEEKAYMIGMRLGDLNVYLPKKSSETIVVRCHSTKDEQIKLVEDMFKKYGKITISATSNNSNKHVNCYLNKSFDFLLSKYNDEIKKWVNYNYSRKISFVAGYTDAEGSLRLNQGRGRFKIDAYDFEILKDINIFLNSIGVHTKFRIIAKKGVNRKAGGTWNNDLWRLNINNAQSLEKLIKIILPFLKHAQRVKDAKNILNNILKRRRNGTIK